MTESKIEWTGRSDWNPIRGCTRVSPGCGGPGPHGGCYAEAMAARFSDGPKPDGTPAQWGHGYAERTSKGGRWTGKIELIEERLTLPLFWRKPAKVFVSSTSDLFHEALPDEAIDRIFAVMAACPQHTFQILTKRPARMMSYMQHAAKPGSPYWTFVLGNMLLDALGGTPPPAWPLANVWLGVSVEDQQRADERREAFRATPAAVKFVSYEPALGPVDWTGWEFVKLIIGGGESGPRARPDDLAWYRSTLGFCGQHGICYFQKQLHGGGPKAIKNIETFPADLRVREMPHG